MYLLMISVKTDILEFQFSQMHFPLEISMINNITEGIFSCKYFLQELLCLTFFRVNTYVEKPDLNPVKN